MDILICLREIFILTPLRQVMSWCHRWCSRSPLTIYLDISSRAARNILIHTSLCTWARLTLWKIPKGRSTELQVIHIKKIIYWTKCPLLTSPWAPYIPPSGGKKDPFHLTRADLFKLNFLRGHSGGVGAGWAWLMVILLFNLYSPHYY